MSDMRCISLMFHAPICRISELFRIQDSITEKPLLVWSFSWVAIVD